MPAGIQCILKKEANPATAAVVATSATVATAAAVATVAVEAG